MTQEECEQLQSGAAEWGISLDEQALERFALFADLLIEGNTRLNLTRVPPSEFVTRHFLDSLALFAIGKWEEVRTVLDVGTGAGFPGIPLAIVRSDWNLTLLDSTRKRLHFLDDVIAKLELPHVQTVHARAEELNKNVPEPKLYDLVVSRAVAPMPRLMEWCLPLTKAGGIMLAYKSNDIQDELNEALPVLHKYAAKSLQSHTIQIPQTDISRTLIHIIKKIQP